MKTCFFISPIGEEGSEIRTEFEGIAESVLRPVLKEFQLELILPNEIDKPGSITNQVIQYLIESELVIANLTGLNANVMYELAIRHACRKEVILIFKKPIDLPFDLKIERNIGFTNDFKGVEPLKQTLRNYLVNCILDGSESQQSRDNPIVRAIRDFSIKDFLMKTTDTDDANSLILSELAEIRQELRIQSFKDKIDSQKKLYLYADLRPMEGKLTTEHQRKVEELLSNIDVRAYLEGWQSAFSEKNNLFSTEFRLNDSRGVELVFNKLNESGMLAQNVMIRNHPTNKIGQAKIVK